MRWRSSPLSPHVFNQLRVLRGLLFSEVLHVSSRSLRSHLGWTHDLILLLCVPRFVRSGTRVRGGSRQIYHYRYLSVKILLIISFGTESSPYLATQESALTILNVKLILTAELRHERYTHGWPSLRLGDESYIAFIALNGNTEFWLATSTQLECVVLLACEDFLIGKV